MTSKKCSDSDPHVCPKRQDLRVSGVSEATGLKLGQTGSASKDFIETVVIAMLAFSLGLAVGAALCTCR
jgi:hypothetical protein